MTSPALFSLLLRFLNQPLFTSIFAQPVLDPLQTHVRLHSLRDLHLPADPGPSRRRRLPRRDPAGSRAPLRLLPEPEAPGHAGEPQDVRRGEAQGHERPDGQVRAQLQPPPADPTRRAGLLRRHRDGRAGKAMCAAQHGGGKEGEREDRGWGRWMMGGWGKQGRICTRDWENVLNGVVCCIFWGFYFHCILLPVAIWRESIGVAALSTQEASKRGHRVTGGWYLGTNGVCLVWIIGTGEHQAMRIELKFKVLSCFTLQRRLVCLVQPFAP